MTTVSSDLAPAELWPFEITPSSWIEIPLDAVLISESGTVRILLKKNWARTVVHCLRFAIVEQDGHESVTLDVEEININRSNFTKLARAAQAKGPSLADFDLRNFTRAARLNTLTLLGFGPIGGVLYGKLFSSRNRHGAAPQTFDLIADPRTMELAGVSEGKSRSERNPSGSWRASITITMPQPELPHLSRITVARDVPQAMFGSLLLSATAANTLLIASILRRAVLESLGKWP